MTRQLADSTVDRFRKRLEEEKERLSKILEEIETDLEESRMTETAAERSPDPGNAEAGSMKFEYEKDLSIGENTRDLIRRIDHALERVAEGGYGTCEVCGNPIPVERLEAIPHATLCVDDAARRR